MTDRTEHKQGVRLEDQDIGDPTRSSTSDTSNLSSSSTIPPSNRDIEHVKRMDQESRRQRKEARAALRLRKQIRRERRDARLQQFLTQLNEFTSRVRNSEQTKAHKWLMEMIKSGEAMADRNLERSRQMTALPTISGSSLTADSLSTSTTTTTLLTGATRTMSSTTTFDPIRTNPTQTSSSSSFSSLSSTISHSTLTTSSSHQTVTSQSGRPLGELPDSSSVWKTLQTQRDWKGPIVKSSIPIPERFMRK